MRVEEPNDRPLVHRRPARRPRAAAATAAAGLALTVMLSGCGGSAGPGASSGAGAGADRGTSPASATAATGTTTAALTVSDAWVKTAKAGAMTAAFGRLADTTDRPITVLSATSPASPKVELHEMVMVNGAAQMRPRQGGFVVPARGTVELKPGSFHIMLMNLSSTIMPGDQVSVTLRLSTGGSVTFQAVAKDFTGGNEKYQPSGAASPGGKPGMSGSAGTGSSPSSSSGM